MVVNSLRTAVFATLMFAVSTLFAGAAEITIAQSTDAVSLDPAFRADAATGNVHRHIFESILYRNNDMELEPRLAEKVERVAPTEWVIILRPGLKFSNGEPLDANSVKFTIERLQDPELKSPIRGWWTGFKTIEIVDERTLKITTADVDPLFEARMTLLVPVPPRYIGEVGNEKFGIEPVTSGAYKIKQWRRDEMIELTANPDYFGGAPSIDKVTFRVLPENLARVAALQTGEVDVISGVSPDQALALENYEGVRVERTPSTRVLAVQFDVNQAPGDDQNFRDAVAAAIDPEVIIKGLFRGYAAPVNSVLSPGIPGWSRDQNFAPKHDLERAKHLVAEHGLGDQEIVMRAPAGRYSLDRETALAVAGQLNAAGLNIKVRPEEWGVFFTDLKNNTMSPVYLMGQGNVWLDPYPQLDAFQRTGGFISTWSDPELDALLDKSNTVKGEERAAVFDTALERLKETNAVVPLLALQDLYGVSKRVVWSPRPDEVVNALEMQIQQ